MSAYADRLEALAAEAADRCTGCGACFEVCPTAREIGLDAGEAKARVGELSALTRGGPAADGLMKWLKPFHAMQGHVFQEKGEWRWTLDWEMKDVVKFD